VNYCDEFLCEVVFADNKSGTLTSLIGTIKISQLNSLADLAKNFLKFKEIYHPPIYIPDIKKLIIHGKVKHFIVKKENLTLN